jgi:hypothetical protein
MPYVDFDVDDLSAELLALVRRDTPSLDREALALKLQEVLFGSRGVWLSYLNAIITLDEAVQAAADHMETWLEDTGTVSTDVRPQNREKLLVLLRSTFQRHAQLPRVP